jgi:hypothetical protein
MEPGIWTWETSDNKRCHILLGRDNRRRATQRDVAHFSVDGLWYHFFLPRGLRLKVWFTREADVPIRHNCHGLGVRCLFKWEQPTVSMLC